MDTHTELSVAEAVADELAAVGIDRVFGLPGGEILNLIEALRQRGIEFVLCRHEASAGLMAAVYGKLRGLPGVVLTTLGPGATNLMLPLSNSLLDREPLLAISADIPSNWPSLHTHQRLPLMESYRPVTKFAAVLDGLSARERVRQAIAASMKEPLGPAFITLSAEDARSPSYESADSVSSSSIDGEHQGIGQFSERHMRATARELRQRLERAERPLVVLGLGVRPTNAMSLRLWLDEWGLAVAVTPKVKGIVDETSSQFVGVVGGMSLDKLMVEALERADLIVGFGLDPVEIDKQWHSSLPILWALESSLATGLFPDAKCLVVGDHSGLLDNLLAADGPPRKWDDAFTDIRNRRNDVYLNGPVEDTTSASSDLKGITPTRLVRALAEIFPPETIVTTDVGSHKYLFGQFWPSRIPETFFMSNGLSGMGYGLPAAVGSKLARPDQPVLCVLGDGGFAMNSAELDTARRVDARFITIVIEDQSYSLIRHAQESRELPNYGVDCPPIDTVLAAQACGAEAVRVHHIDELNEAVKGAYSAGRCLVVAVPMDPDAYKGLV